MQKFYDSFFDFQRAMVIIIGMNDLRHGSDSMISCFLSSLEHQIFAIIDKYQTFLYDENARSCGLYTREFDNIAMSIFAHKPSIGYMTYDICCYHPEFHEAEDEYYAHFIITDTSHFSKRKPVSSLSLKMFNAYSIVLEGYRVPVFDLRHRKVTSDSPLRGAEIIQCIEGLLGEMIKKNLTKSRHLALSTQQYPVFKRAVQKLGMHLVATSPSIIDMELSALQEKLIEKKSITGKSIQLIDTLKSPWNPEAQEGPHYELLHDTMMLDRQILRMYLTKSLVPHDPNSQLFKALI